MGMERVQRSRRYQRVLNLNTFPGGGHLHDVAGGTKFHEPISQGRPFMQFFPRYDRDNDEIIPI
jgi:hypothetical protein